ncbi:serine hydrolase [Mammaliicoccus sp. Dog046]|uniref:serine hydrolase n=1 Tax=Mammaliicoccus sp. Dog046 TaxID=3034233 RepID=UPI002B261FE3|nr:serine hydrolase [Mammaliicoccus sp. Dog046]WQK85367.1 serine hydrolase [Mammaliicoccus sp. Dog046]
MTFLTHELMDHNDVSLEFANEHSTIFTNHHYEKTFESASLIKLPIMIYIFNQLNDDEMQESLTIDQSVGGSGVLQSLHIRQLSIQDLVYLMIVVSDNTATNILIDHFGLHHINQFIETDLECTETKLSRRMMDEQAISEGKQNVTSAQDIIRILRYITNHAHHKEMMDILHEQHLNDKVSIYQSFYDSKLKFHSKTGEYDNVINDVGIIQHHDTFYYYCFLSNTKTPEKAIQFSHDFGSYMIHSILNE